MIDFSEPSSGATATLSVSSQVTDVGGQASVTATANATPGTYAVTASAAGVVSSFFDLTNYSNLIQPVFSDLLSPTIHYGTASVDFTGKIADGSQVATERRSR